MTRLSSRFRDGAVITGGRVVGQAELAGRVDELAADLRTVVPPGATVGVQVADAATFVLAVRALVALRAEVFLIAPESGPERLAQLASFEKSTLRICDHSIDPASHDVLATSRAGVRLVGQSPVDSTSRHDEGTVHFYSSGTEGAPRGVVRTWHSLEHEAGIVGAHLGMRPGVRVLCAVPPVHGYGFTGGLFAPLAAGATSVCVAPARASSLAAVLQQHAPEIVYGVPAQYAAWSRRVPPYDGPRPRLWISSGAPLPDAVRDAFEQAWGASIAEQYGMTECGAVSIDLESSGTLGRPYPGVRIRLDHEPTGSVVVDTPHGPCCWAGPGRGDHAAPFAAGGFRSGDVGTWDAAGRLRLVGRRTHHINVRGRKVDPVVVERALWALPGVRDVHVLGMDRATGDQWIAAFVARSEPATTTELAGILGRLDDHERPQRVLVLPALPKTPTQKTDVGALRGMLARSSHTSAASYSAGPT